MTDLGAIERWADDHFSQGEVAVIMRLVVEHGWLPPEFQTSVQIEPEQMSRMKDLVELTKHDAPLSVETIVFLAVDAFMDGADGK